MIREKWKIFTLTILMVSLYANAQKALSSSAVIEPTEVDIEVMVAAASQIDSDRHDEFTIVLEPKLFGSHRSKGDLETSAILRSVYERITSQTLNISVPIKRGRFRFVSAETDVKDAETSKSKITSGCSMLLPGYSEDKNKAAVFASFAWGPEGYKEFFSGFYFLQYQDGKWRVTGSRDE